MACHYQPVDAKLGKATAALAVVKLIKYLLRDQTLAGIAKGNS